MPASSHGKGRRTGGAARSGALAIAAGLVALLAGLTLTGCQTPEPRATTQPTVPQEGNAELIMHISSQPFVTAEPAYRAAYLLSKGETFAGSFDELADAMRSEGLIGKGWRHTPEQLLDRAAIGFLICRACDIRSGLNWNLTGLGRYAWRELQYHRIAAGGSEYGLMSGGEFVGVLSRAEDYLRRTGKRDAEGAELGPATGG